MRKKGKIILIAGALVLVALVVTVVVNWDAVSLAIHPPQWNSGVPAYDPSVKNH